MRTSDSTGKLAEALAKAQAVLVNPPKDALNPHFKNKYASLDGGLIIVRSALSGVNIAFTQSTRLDGELLVLETRLSHPSGEWMESEYPVCKFPSAPQAVGSAMSYAKRYALFSLVGIAGGDDDDGEATKHAETPAAKKSTQEDASAKWSREKASALIKTLQMADNLPDLSAWRENNRQAVNGLFPEDKKAVSASYEEHAHKLTEKVEG